MFIDVEKPDALSKQAVPSRQDVLDAKRTVRASCSGVVATLFLILSNQFDQNLLHCFTAGILRNDAVDCGFLGPWHDPGLLAQSTTSQHSQA